MARCPTCHRRLGFGATCPVDGARAPAAPAIRARCPLRIAGYELGEPLGRGGSSTVWAATRASDGESVAIKIAHAASEYARERFAREASVLEQLPANNAPALLEHGELGGDIPFLVMERLRGSTLATYLETREHPDDSDVVIAIAKAILANLAAVHARGLSHHDLKPNNIFLVSGPPAAETRLLDFGLASILASPVDEESMHVVAGTVEYMAPERIGHLGETDQRADIYGFGVVLYELMTLRVPFVGDRALIERGHVALRPPRPSAFAPVPAELEALTRACLEKNPARRPTTDEVARWLERTVGAPSAPASERSAAGAAELHIQSSHQPVVVLVADIESTDAVAEIHRRGGVVVRQRGKRHVCAFTSTYSEEPALAALSAAEALAQRGLSAALHLAQLRVRQLADERAPRVYGLAVERLSEWLPAVGWSGIVLTEEFAAAIDLGLEPHPDLPSFRRPVDADRDSTQTGPLIGRSDVLDAGTDSLSACFSSRTPGLFTIVGGAGLGKSRLAAELAVRAAAIEDTRVVQYRARSGVDNQRGLLSSIGAAPLAFIPEHDAARDVGALLVAAAKVHRTALIIDDAHRLGDHLCDAVEYATLDTADAPLWIAVTAGPRFASRRRQWGWRANRHRRMELAPLAEGSGMELAAELLKPADYPPAAILRRLVDWAGGNPFFLVEIVRALKRGGLVRERVETGSFYVATTALDKLPAIAAGQWLATRQLEAMPGELAALVRLCAVLGNDFTRDELAWVQDAADRLVAAPSSVDTDVGLAELERLGTLRRDRRRWSFVNEAVLDAISRSLTESDVDHLRGAAMTFWREAAESGDATAMLRFAGHAAAVGERVAATETYLTLGDSARAEHRIVDADQLYSAALDLADNDTLARARALGGRGEVRYRMQRLTEAVADLEAATALARKLGDRTREANWLLAQATALDWADLFGESAARVEEAGKISAESGDPVLAARCMVSMGRTRWRQERIEEAIDLLDRGAAQAASHNDYEYRVIALLLLPLALVFAERRAEAETRFAEVITLCETAGDRLHLCAAYGNRMFLWRNDTQRAVEDLRRANQLAREVGQAGAERVTTHNLAEILFWSGESAESLALAERAFELQRRLLTTPVAADSLLVARIHAGRREWARVRERLDWISENVAADSLPPTNRLVIDMLALAINSVDRAEDMPGEWDELIDHARPALAAEELLELLYLRGCVALDLGAVGACRDVLAEAQPRLASCAVWRDRYRALDAGSSPPAGAADKLGRDD